jgi:hypothetical protein
VRLWVEMIVISSLAWMPSLHIFEKDVSVCDRNWGSFRILIIGGQHFLEAN